ncbi:MAG: RluA family pseudouridine synthase [Oligoflexia bacterium]|nr:RluA family pseudouridine synthase [Oligoflexia bacterium]
MISATPTTPATPVTPIKKICGSDNSFTFIFNVEKDHHGLRLDQFIKRFMGHKTSREFIKKKIKRGHIIIEASLKASLKASRMHQQSHFKQTFKASSTVLSNDQVKMTIFPSDSLYELEYEHWFNKNITIDTKPLTIHEDDNIIVTCKPPFMATYPTGRHSFNCVTVYYENQLKQNLHSIHRLDRETSGILILGKNPRVSHALSFCFEHSLVKKCYFLIAKIKIKDINQSIGNTPIKSLKSLFPLIAEERIGRSSSRMLMETYPKDSSEGKEAKTIFKFIDQIENYILLLAYPQTGRQHQIRVHAAAHGFPLVGDKIYGGNSSLFLRYKDKVTTTEDYLEMELPRQALHAIALNFPYNPHLNLSALPPAEKNSKNIKNILSNTKRVTYITPLPTDLRDWMLEKKIDLNLVAQQINFEL